MSAHTVYHNAPLGSLVRYSDGTPKPPARFARKLAAWEHRHGIARLVKKEPPRDRPNGTSPASIKLHERVSAGGGALVLTVMRIYSIDSDLHFEVIERPAIGTVRILQEYGGNTELLHLAASHEAAERWLAEHRYSKISLEVVTEEEVGADVVESGAA